MAWTLQTMTRSLRAELAARRHAGTFARATMTHHVLAPFGSAEDLLVALAGRAGSTAVTDRRTDITRAVLAEHQAGRSPFWAALLLLTYYPMLSRLRHRVRADVPDEEVDQIVLAAFLEVAATVRLNARCLQLELRRLTERQVFAAVNREESEMRQPTPAPQLATLVDKRVGTPLAESVPAGPVEDASGRLLEQVAPDRADLVRTYGTGTSLRDWVRAQYPDAGPQELERHYQRLKKARTRARSYLRAISEVIEG